MLPSCRTPNEIDVLSVKFLIPLLAGIVMSGCDSGTPTTPNEAGSGLSFQTPEKIRTSLAVNVDNLTGIANVNGRPFEMQRTGEQFQATISNVPVNSEVSIDLIFSETLDDGRVLNLANTETQTFNVGNTDRTITIVDEDFSYAFDDDNDQISNIAERNDGTDPFTPENAGTRTITVEFTLPLRITDPLITSVTALIADIPRSRTSPAGTFFQASGLVSTLNTIDIDIRLNQLFQGSNVTIARAVTSVDPGTQDLTAPLSDPDFDFSFDSDNDGVLNIDELQDGTDPFIAQ